MKIHLPATRNGAAALIAAAVLAAGCSPGKPSSPVLRIIASDSGFSLPAQVPAGLTQVRLFNGGQLPHEGMLVHFTAPGSAAAYADSFRGGVDFPANAEDIGGAGIAVPGDSTSMWLNLDPGRYAVLCFYDGHLEQGAAADFEVVPHVSVAASPATDIQIHMSNFSYQVTGRWTAGHHVVLVENGGPEPHEFDPYRLLPGKKPEDYFRWMEGGRKGPAPAIPLGGSGSMVRGRKVWLPLTLTPGRYFAFCEVPAHDDGKPHYRHGMFREFEVPEGNR